MDNETLLRRAYRWFGVAAPTKLTLRMRKDYGTTMKEYSAWVRQDKTDNPEKWEELDAEIGKQFS